MKYQISHRTLYHYAAEVTLCHNQACLLPRELPGQRCLHSRLQVNPGPTQLLERRDFFDNRINYFSLQTPHKTLSITAQSTIEVAPPPPYPKSPPWEQVRTELAQDFSTEGLNARALALGSVLVGFDPAINEYARLSFKPGRPLLDAVHDLTHRIYEDFAYDPHFTTVVTPLSEVFEHRRGVCQDFAHLAISCLRGLGLAARYVSGYLETLPPPGQPKLQGADASHAWLSVYLPGQGWFDFDPTNDQPRTEQYITIGWGRDYADVTPVKGILYGGGKHKLDVAVDVDRIT